MAEPTPASSDSRSEWLVGERLEAALAADGGSDKIEVRWPFLSDSEPQDWEGREFVLIHVYSLLNIKPSNNTHPLLLVPPSNPSTLPLSDQALYCQMAFENLNAPIFSLLPAPLAALYAQNAVTGAVLHVGRKSSEVAIVTDSVVRWECSTSVDIGEADCEEYLEKLLLNDKALNTELATVAGVSSWEPGQREKLVREIREFIFAECTGDDIEIPVAKGSAKAVVVAAAPEAEDDAFDVAKKLTADAVPQPAASNSHKSKKQQAQAAAAAASKASAAADAAAAAIANDFIAVTIPSLPDKEIAVGPVRHRLCEPLLLGKTPGGDTVWEAVGRAVESSPLTIFERLQIWDGIAVVGDIARFKSFPIALASYLSPFLLSSTDLPSDSQADRVRLLSIPEYIANFKGATSEVAPFLGASMVAKVAFNDTAGKHYVNKVDYNLRGPAAIYGVWQDA
ncbi:hypothetical protein VHUM_02481 [Vanrija humicola]|uniref:RNA polymerase II transcription factor n=1 Tax=Vanrija humicola TaxID=5417 RepID=A0A7D8ZMR5_VANHU|nr:hypothetical protein VHUM_02481 [Vanrija humicola]